MQEALLTLLGVVLAGAVLMWDAAKPEPVVVPVATRAPAHADYSADLPY